MKSTVAILALAAVFTQTSYAALNPSLIQQIGQKMIDKVIEQDSLVRALDAEFDISKTNLEQNIVLARASANVKNLPWAKTEQSRALTEASYRAVYEPSYYGVEAQGRVKAYTQVIEAIRYASKEVNKEQSNGSYEYEVETRAILVQLETVQNFNEVYRLMNELNNVGRKVLAKNIGQLKEGLDADNNSGSGPCYKEASYSGQYDWSIRERCMNRAKTELNAYEMAAIVQNQSTIVNKGEQGILIFVKDPAAILDNLPNKGQVQKFEGMTTQILIQKDFVQATTSGFVGLRKYDMDKLDAEFKKALNKYQAQDADQAERVEQDMRQILVDVKKFIRMAQ
jgi:hypothetical protein